VVYLERVRGAGFEVREDHTRVGKKNAKPPHPTLACGLHLRVPHLRRSLRTTNTQPLRAGLTSGAPPALGWYGGELTEGVGADRVVARIEEER
jgi:hypothetical protein